MIRKKLITCIMTAALVICAAAVLKLTPARVLADSASADAAGDQIIQEGEKTSSAAGDQALPGSPEQTLPGGNGEAAGGEQTAQGGGAAYASGGTEQTAQGGEVPAADGAIRSGSACEGTASEGNEEQTPESGDQTPENTGQTPGGSDSAAQAGDTAPAADGSDQNAQNAGQASGGSDGQMTQNGEEIRTVPGSDGDDAASDGGEAAQRPDPDSAAAGGQKTAGGARQAVQSAEDTAAACGDGQSVEEIQDKSAADDPCEKDDPEEKILKTQAADTFTVTFKDGVTGKTLKTQKVASGKAASAPSAPAHPGYAFSKWDKSFGKVTADMTVTARYVYKNGFASEGSNRVYYHNGKKAEGQRYLSADGGKTYYWYMFRPGSGAMVRDMFFNHDANTNPKGGDKTCYYDKNGHMVYGQRHLSPDGGKNYYWYMFNTRSGAMVKGTFFDHNKDTNPKGGNKTCYYDGKGRMQYGQRRISTDGGKNYFWYMFNMRSGAMIKEQFYTHDSESNPSGGAKTCYYDGKGRMQYGQRRLTKDGGKSYYYYMFNMRSGAMVKGWFNHTKETNASGAKKVYYSSSGRMIYGWQKIGSKIYVFNTGSGALLGEWGSQVTWIGDSYSSLAAGRIISMVPGVDLYEQPGRRFAQDRGQFPSGLTELIGINNRGRLKNCLVMALGTNDNTLTGSNLSAAQVQHAVDIAGRGRQVVLMLPYDKRGATGMCNYNAAYSALMQAVRNNSNVVIADWPAVSAGRVNQYWGSDPIHPVSAGLNAWTDLMVNTIRGLAKNDARY